MKGARSKRGPIPLVCPMFFDGVHAWRGMLNQQAPTDAAPGYVWAVRECPCGARAVGPRFEYRAYYEDPPRFVVVTVK